LNVARYLAITLVLIVVAGGGVALVLTRGRSAAGVAGLVAALVAAAVAFSYYLSVRTKRRGATPIPR